MGQSERSEKMSSLSNIRSKLKDCHWLVPRLWLAFAFLWNMWFQVFKGQALLDSDMASEMVLSNLLNKEASISGLSTNWIYSTEIRVLYLQWFFRIGLLISPNNWHIARTIGMFMALSLLVFAVWLVFYSVDQTELGVWAAAFTLFPGGGWYFWLTLSSGSYIPFLCISLFSFSLSLLSIKKLKSIRSGVYLAIVMLLGIGAGLQGVKQLMLFYAPWILTAGFILFVVIKNRETEKRKQTIAFFVISACASAFSFAGYLINSNILSKYYIFKDFGEIKIKSKNFLELFREYIWSFGYVEGKVLLSPVGIASMCGVIFGLIVVGSGIMAIKKYSKMEYKTRILTVFSLISIVFLIFLFSYTPKGNIEYYMTIVPMGYFLLLIVISISDYSCKKSRFIITNLMIALLLVISLGTVYNEEHEPCHNFRAKPGLNDLVTWLKGGYEMGVSDFWTSNIVTELSDGSIDMWTYNSDDRDWLEWLQRKDHMGAFPQGRYFYLIENKNIDEDQDEEYYVNLDAMNAFLADHPELTLIYQDDLYTVYGVL